MKGILLRLLLAVAITLVAVALASSVRAQQADEDPSPNGSARQEQPGNQEPQSKTTTAEKSAADASSNDPQTQDALAFTGVVTRGREGLRLEDPVTKSVYRLDEPAKAEPYVGKQVKVIGKLAMSSNTIHIEAIEALPPLKRMHEDKETLLRRLQADSTHYTFLPIEISRKIGSNAIAS